MPIPPLVQPHSNHTRLFAVLQILKAHSCLKAMALNVLTIKVFLDIYMTLSNLIHVSIQMSLLRELPKIAHL